MFEGIRKFFAGSKQENELAFAPPEDGLYQVAADESRCVQCGICGYNCPVGIEVREYARRGLNVTDSSCISCGECILRCPRGTLSWGTAVLLQRNEKLQVDPQELPLTLDLRPRHGS
jgi:ferredoxin